MGNCHIKFELLHLNQANKSLFDIMQLSSVHSSSYTILRNLEKQFRELDWRRVCQAGVESEFYCKFLLKCFYASVCLKLAIQ